MIFYFQHCIRWLGNISYAVSALLILIIAASVFWEVVARYFFNLSSIWITEVSGYLLADALFLGMGRTYRINGHVRMSVLLERLSPKAACLCYWLADAIVAVFAVALLWQTIALTLDAYQFQWKSSTLLETPLYLPQILMSLGAFIFLLEVLYTASLRRPGRPLCITREE